MSSRMRSSYRDFGRGGAVHQNMGSVPRERPDTQPKQQYQLNPEIVSLARMELERRLEGAEPKHEALRQVRAWLQNACTNGGALNTFHFTWAFSQTSFRNVFVVNTGQAVLELLSEKAQPTKDQLAMLIYGFKRWEAKVNPPTS